MISLVFRLYLLWSVEESSHCCYRPFGFTIQKLFQFGFKILMIKLRGYKPRRTKKNSEGRMMKISGVGANPCVRPDRNGQGQATTPTYPLYRSETIFDGT